MLLFALNGSHTFIRGLNQIDEWSDTRTLVLQLQGDVADLRLLTATLPALDKSSARASVSIDALREVFATQEALKLVAGELQVPTPRHKSITGISLVLRW